MDRKAVVEFMAENELKRGLLAFQRNDLKTAYELFSKVCGQKR